MRASEQVQVQLRLPLTSQPREQRCSTSIAHESLRRFAQGYVFGSASRIGASESTERQQSVATPSTAFRSNDLTDFASCAVEKEDDIREKTARRKRPEGRRSALVFGENAPRVTLSVKERIERKTVPKRCRESVSVDALSAMMEKLLSDESSLKRCKSGGDDDDLARTLGDMKFRRKSSERIGKSKYAKSTKSTIPDPVRRKADEQRVAAQIAQLEDEDTADELSFLVNRCDLDSDKKQATFMPYIT